MKFKCEKAKDILEEIKPLLNLHWKEIAQYPDIILDPDYDQYLKMDELGLLKCYTLRDENNNELIGYALYFIKPHIHYKSCLVALQDILFIRQDRRGHGRQFIKWCDDQLKELGVNLVSHHIKAKHNWGFVLEHMGYELMDLIYVKRLL